MLKGIILDAKMFVYVGPKFKKRKKGAEHVGVKFYRSVVLLH